MVPQPVIAYQMGISALSNCFSGNNGVRQRGVLSPLLFNVYIDDLSVPLPKLPVDCCCSKIVDNHKGLPTPSAKWLLTPSAKGLLTPSAKGLLAPSAKGLLTPSAKGLLTPSAKGLLTPSAKGLLTPSAKGLLTPSAKGLLAPSAKGLLTPSAKGLLAPSAKGLLTPSAKRLLTPSAKGLQRLLDASYTYGCSNDILLKSKKSQVMVFNTMKSGHVVMPGEMTLNITKSY